MQAPFVSSEAPRRSALSQIFGGLFAPDRDRDPARAAPQPAGDGRAATAPDAGLLERQYPIRIRLSPPADGHDFAQLQVWLSDRAGADGWAMATAGSGRSHSLALYLLDPMVVGDFVVRWCATERVEAAEGVFRIRNAEVPIQLADRRKKRRETVRQSLAPAA